jgi:YD repeat-containing protein
MTYDGYGRLKTKHVPEQNAGTNTVWTYNPDDTISTITDARGAVTTYGYNSRSLPTSITHTLAGAAGNRTAMTDSLGTTSYSYDQLSHLTSETRGLTGVGNYTISYQYNRNNNLSSITSPANTGSITVNYTRDTVGRPTAITRPGQTLASAISYRASGDMKHMLYGDNSTMDVTYNSRLLPATYNIPGKIYKSYTYHDDGTLRFSSDAMDHRFDRSYGFDHVGRLKSAYSGAEARGEGTTSNRPYYQTYGYDAFDHLNQRTVKTWSTGDYSVSWSFVNNRRLGINWQYDADGRRVHADGYYSYDAAGRNNYMEVAGSSLPIAEITFDGDGRQIKTIDSWVDENFERLYETKYYIRSTLLGGQVLAELDEWGAVWRSYVFAGPSILGWLWHSYNDAFMSWRERDPSKASVRGIGEQELDPLGANAGTFATSVPPTERAIVSYGSSYDPANPGMTYSVDGIRMPVEDFVHHAGFVLGNPLALLEFWVKNDPSVGRAPEELDELRGILGPSLRSGGLPDITLLPQEPAKPSHDKYSGQGPQTACHIMADVAQNEANTAIYQNSNNFNAALSQFDRTFSTLYVGGPMVSLAEARRLSPGNLRTINPNEPFTGGSGFKNEYKDSGPEPPPIGGPTADQTHHFAAFLSLGINRQSAIYAYRHYVQGDNQGDLNLDQAAFRLGTELRRHGRMSTLTQIGDIIRRTVCDTAGHGLYLN